MTKIIFFLFFSFLFAAAVGRELPRPVGLEARSFGGDCVSRANFLRAWATERGAIATTSISAVMPENRSQYIYYAFIGGLLHKVLYFLSFLAPRQFFFPGIPCIDR
jgi:hypothetical protein